MKTYQLKFSEFFYHTEQSHPLSCDAEESATETKTKINANAELFTIHIISGS